MSDDEEYEYDYGSDAEYDYGSDGGNENEENEDADDGAIAIENSFYGKLVTGSYSLSRRFPLLQFSHSSTFISTVYQRARI